MRLSTEAERARLHDTFVALCRIDSPSGHERPCTDHVAAELRAMGVEVDEDDAGSAAGADAGNLFARIEGTGPETVMMCAHLDTVPATDAVEPVIVNGGYENANEAILGADNKAAVAVILELARRLASTPTPPAVGLELIFTVSEENGLHGAKAFDTGRLRSGFGYTFDHASPIGEIVLASPTYQRVIANLRGVAAHAGLKPEDGRSAIVAAARGIGAMRLGRLDDETTANVGVIDGGTATNVVPERCRVEAEVRSLSEERVEHALTEMIDAFQDAADAAECDLDLTVEKMFTGYRLKPTAAPVTLAERALRSAGYDPRPIVTGGGADANAFISAGFECVNLANGTERNHRPDERVSVDALEGMLDVAMAIIDEATHGV